MAVKTKTLEKAAEEDACQNRKLIGSKSTAINTHSALGNIYTSICSTSEEKKNTREVLDTNQQLLATNSNSKLVSTKSMLEVMKV